MCRLSFALRQGVPVLRPEDSASVNRPSIDRNRSCTSMVVAACRHHPSMSAYNEERSIHDSQASSYFDIRSRTSAALALTVCPAQQAAVQKTSTPTMDFGTWGVDICAGRPVRRSGRRFQRLRQQPSGLPRTRIPGDRTRFGAFDMLSEEVDRNVEGLVRDLVASNPAPGTPNGRIVDAYRPIIDTDAIDASRPCTGLSLSAARSFRARSGSSCRELFEQAGYPGARKSQGWPSMLADPTDCTSCRSASAAWACPTAIIIWSIPRTIWKSVQHM